MYQQGYIDAHVHSMSLSYSCLCSFLCNPYITLQISLFTCVHDLMYRTTCSDYSEDDISIMPTEEIHVATSDRVRASKRLETEDYWSGALYILPIWTKC